MIEFTVAEGEVVDGGGFDHIGGRTHPVSVDPQDVNHVDGHSELWERPDKWTSIHVRGVGTLIVKGSYQEVKERLMKPPNPTTELERSLTEVQATIDAIERRQKRTFVVLIGSGLVVVLATAAYLIGIWRS